MIDIDMNNVEAVATPGYVIVRKSEYDALKAKDEQLDILLNMVERRREIFGAYIGEEDFLKMFDMVFCADFLRNLREEKEKREKEMFMGRDSNED